MGEKLCGRRFFQHQMCIRDRYCSVYSIKRHSLCRRSSLQRKSKGKLRIPCPWFISKIILSVLLWNLLVQVPPSGCKAVLLLENLQPKGFLLLYLCELAKHPVSFASFLYSGPWSPVLFPFLLSPASPFLGISSGAYLSLLSFFFSIRISQ